MMTKSIVHVEVEKQQLLVDSRIIAAEMEVDHGNWFRNIVQKYQQEVEDNFGVFRFKNGKPKKKGGRPEKYCMLTENQVYYVLTLSRNSKRVIELKAKLVKSFSRCRKQIQVMQLEIEKNKSLPAWQEERKKTKLANKRLSDAVYEFNQCNMMSYRRTNNMYTVVATASSKAIVGCAPWIYKKQKMVDNFRDALDQTQLAQLDLIENLAAHLIENQNVYPKNAIEQAAAVVKPKHENYEALRIS